MAYYGMRRRSWRGEVLVCRILAFVLVSVLAAPLFSQQERNYGASSVVKFTLVDPAGISLASAVCATVAGTANDDVQISKDEGPFADSTNCFTAEGNGDYSLVLTAAEMTAARITISIRDQTATKVWLDTNVYVESYGNTLAQHPVSRSAAGFAASVSTLMVGTVDTAGFTPTSTTFEASSILDGNGVNYADDASGKFTDTSAIKWVSGANAGTVRRILSHTLVSGRARIQVETMNSQPANGDRFIIL